MSRGGGWQITPRRTSTGWLGITRSSGVSGNASTRTSVGTPASTETTAGARPRSSPATSSRAPGLTARTRASESPARAGRLLRVSPPTCAASAAARAVSRSQNSIASGPPSAPAHPRAIAPAMFPAPANPILIAGRLVASGLVEKALLDQASLLLGRDLDVGGCEQEGLVRDLLHSATERVGEAGGEVDQAPRQLGLG